MTDKFRIKKETYKNKTLRLPEELIEECTRVANENDVSFNHFVIQALKFSLKNMDSDQE